jgi:hypothetical protein
MSFPAFIFASTPHFGEEICHFLLLSSPPHCIPAKRIVISCFIFASTPLSSEGV